MHHAQDYGGLLLLATASGNADMVGKLAVGADRDGKTNVAFLTYFLQGRLDKCLDLLIKTDRLPEAAFLARTYLPSQVSRVVKLWKESLSNVNQKAADALADPSLYSNLFPGLQQALLAEQYLKETHVRVRPAAEYPLITPNEDRDVLEESAGFVAKQEFSESKEVAEDMFESTVAAVIDAEPATVEESIPTAASPVLMTVKEEHMEQHQAESVDTEEAALEPEMEAVTEDIVTKSVEALVSSEENIVEERIIAITPKEPEVVPPSTGEDVTPVEEDVQDVSHPAEVLAAGAESSLNEIASDTILPTEEIPCEETETMATEDVIDVTFDADVIVSGTTSEQLIDEELGKDTVPLDVPSNVDIEAPVAEEKPEEVVAEIIPPIVAVEELISFDNAAGLVDEPVPVQAPSLTDLTLEPVLEPLLDAIPVLEPVPAQKSDEEKHSTALPVEPEKNMEPTDVLKAEILNPAAAEEANPAGTEEPEKDLGAAMIDEGLDDLDLDNFDLEDIDPTDVDLDEDFLIE